MCTRLLASFTIASLSFASLASAQSTDVEKAYKRELAFLDAERDTLSKRLGEVKREREQKETEARNELDRLQGRATSLSLEADRLEELLAEVESEAAADAETRDILDSTLQQAEVALSKGDIQLPELPDGAGPDRRIEQLDFAFAKSLELLDRYSKMRKEQGAFFDRSGRKVEGTILHVGQVAAYGVSERAAGALAPAGNGKLKVWPEGDSSESARALVQGQTPATVQMFLFESLEKEVEKSKEKTFEDLMKAGGPIGWVIVCLGILAGVLALIRIALLARAATNTERLLGEVGPLVKAGRVDTALDIARKAKNPVGRVLEATLKNLTRPREVLDDLIAEAVMREQPALDRFGSTILIAAAVGPLLGLLGTVTGMISTFDIITEYGNGNPKLLAGGISEALVTTELGLLVAIPALLLGNMLGGWASRIKDDLDSAALRITNIASGDDIADLTREPPARVPELAPAE